MAYQRRADHWEDDSVQIDCHRIKSVALVLPSDFGPSQQPHMQTCASASHRYCQAQEREILVAHTRARYLRVGSQAVA